MRNIIQLLKEKAINLVFVWGLSLLIMWSFTKSIRPTILLVITYSLLAIKFKWFREILLVSSMSIIPLLMVFSGLDVFVASGIFAIIAVIIDILVRFKKLPRYFSASLYVPVLVITLVIGQTL